METNESVEILNDLIKINNDRIRGYEKALQDLKQVQNPILQENLHQLFINFIDQSRQNRNELGNEVQSLGGTMADDTTTSGKIYRSWRSLKAVFTGHDAKSILESCESGEDAAQKAYQQALSDDLPAYQADLVQSQKNSLRTAHDKVKSLRDKRD